MVAEAAVPGSLTPRMTGVFLDCYRRQQISPEMGLDPLASADYVAANNIQRNGEARIRCT